MSAPTHVPGHDVVADTVIRDAKQQQAIQAVLERLNVWAGMLPEERAELRAWFPEQIVLKVISLTASDDPSEIESALRELLDVIALEAVLPDIEPSLQRARAALATAEARR